MREVYEQVGTNTSMLSVGFVMVALTILAAGVIQGLRNPEKKPPKGWVYTLLGMAGIAGAVALFRLPDDKLLMWLPFAAAAGMGVMLMATKGLPLGMRLGCTGLLFLLASPFWFLSSMLLGRNRATLALNENELVYESDFRPTAVMKRELVTLRVVPVSSSKHVLEISDGKQKVPISSRFLFRSEDDDSIDVDELQTRIEQWVRRGPARAQ